MLCNHDVTEMILMNEGTAMKNLKKLGTALAATLLCLNISACQSVGSPTVTTAATMPEAQTRATVSAVQTQGKEDLIKLLDQVEENVFPGTAGSTITAVPYTAKLLDWCKSTGLSENEMIAAENGWMRGKDKEELSRKFSLILETYQLLMGKDAESLMETAGYETDSYPWPDSCATIMTTLLSALGAE